MFHKCSYCDYQSPYKGNLKTHIKNKHKNIAGGSVRTPFTEQDELHVKDEVKDPELLEDSIKRKCEENAINVDELTKMFESMTLN